MCTDTVERGNWVGLMVVVEAASFLVRHRSPLSSEELGGPIGYSTVALAVAAAAVKELGGYC